MSSDGGMKRELGIYVHIPFCARKCLYCDFLSFPAGRQIQRSYFQALNREITGSEGAEKYDAVSVYFGGGTPSLADASLVCGTLDVIRSKFSLRDDAEITIECNPGTLTYEKLAAYRTSGFNRLSMGLQSADNEMLKKLGRIHTWEKFSEEYRQARQAGFDNISVDLMYGLPGQTCEMWRETLDKVLSLPDSCRSASGESDGIGRRRAAGPEHISAYSLIIEEGTPFWDLYHEDAEAKARGDRTLFLPSEDDEDCMLSDLKEYLGGAGMRRYEISNWSYPGFESRHNTGYWIRREYAGFGLGASGQIADMRIKNTGSMSEYLGYFLPRAGEGGPEEEGSAHEGYHPGCKGDPGLSQESRENKTRRKSAEGSADGVSKSAEQKKHPSGSNEGCGRQIIHLSRQDEIEETMFLGLRRMEGVDLKKFAETFGFAADEIYGSVTQDLTRNGLLETTSDGHLRLTERGIDISNLVMSQFLLD